MSVSQPQNTTFCRPYALSSHAIVLKWDRGSARIHPSGQLRDLHSGVLRRH
jgi:hypothetical protein